MGVWIEIELEAKLQLKESVTPCMGVWIEMTCALLLAVNDTSLPVWECGLKYVKHYFSASSASVTPCMGVWIEICYSRSVIQSSSVTPCMGVWIEIKICLKSSSLVLSLPVWECGLK